MTVVVRHREHGWLRDSFTGGDYTADFDEAVGYPDSDHAWQVIDLAEIPRDGLQVIPLHAAQAVAQMLAIKGLAYINRGGGGGNQNGPTTGNGILGYDCVGAVVRAYRHLGWTRTRPGYAQHPPGSAITGVLHCDSWRHDAVTRKVLVERVTTPAIGDLITYPNFYYTRPDGKRGRKASHVELVVDILAAEWPDPRYDIDLVSKEQIAPWHLLVTAGARGGEGRSPVIQMSARDTWAKHDAKWLRKPSQRTWLIRPVIG